MKERAESMMILRLQARGTKGDGFSTFTEVVYYGLLYYVTPSVWVERMIGETALYEM